MTDPMDDDDVLEDETKTPGRLATHVRDRGYSQRQRRKKDNRSLIKVGRIALCVIGILNILYGVGQLVALSEEADDIAKEEARLEARGEEDTSDRRVLRLDEVRNTPRRFGTLEERRVALGVERMGAVVSIVFGAFCLGMFFWTARFVRPPARKSAGEADPES